MTTRRPAAGYLVLTDHRSDSPILRATLGQQLSMVGIPSCDVVVVAGGGPPSVDWSDHVVAGKLGARSPARILRFLMAVAREVVLHPRRAVYARDPLAALVPSMVPRSLRRFRLLYDRRGVVADEARLRGSPGWAVRLLAIAERFAILRADRVQVVSETMRLVTEESGGSGLSITVCPNGAVYDERAIQVAAARERPRIGYVGGAGVWQLIEQTLELLCMLAADGRVDVAVWSYDPSLVAAARAKGLPAASVGPDDVASVLSDLSAVVAFRADDIVNRAASPIKLAEALSVGCGIISTRHAHERLRDVPEGVFLVEDVGRPQIDRIVDWLEQLNRDPSSRSRIFWGSRSTYDLAAYKTELTSFWM